MIRKLLALIIAFFVFSFSLPQNAAASLLCADSVKNDVNAISSPMKLINMLDISMKMAKVCYESGKEFLSGFRLMAGAGSAADFFDTGKSIFIFVSKDVFAFRQLRNSRTYNNEPRDFANASYKQVFLPDKYRLRRMEIVNVFLLYIEALHKSSLPAYINSIMKFYSPALGISPEAGFIFWSPK